MLGNEHFGQNSQPSSETLHARPPSPPWRAPSGVRSLRSGLTLASAGSICCALGCAQLLGTDDYEVDPSLFEDASALDDTTEPQAPDAATSPQETESPTDTTDEPDGPTGTPEGGVPTPSPSGDAGVASPPATPDASVPVITPDAGPVVPEADSSLPPQCQPSTGGSCELQSQCGCETDQMCTVVDTVTGATGCRPAGTTAPYSTCLLDNDCQAGHGCVGGVCKRFCDGTVTDTCESGPYAQCVQVTDGQGDIPGYFVCFRTCNPTAPETSDDTYEGCGPGVNCLPGPDGVSSCLASDTPGVRGDACETAQGEPDPFACAPGYACVSTGAEWTCKRSCDVAAPDCGPGLACNRYAEPQRAAEREIGYCDVCPGLNEGACDVVTQCGCAPDEMCAVTDFVYGGTACMPKGDVPLGESCNVVVGECEPGTECLHWIDTGVCTAFCNDPSDCPNGTPCVEWEVPGVKMCLSGCDPTDPQSSTAPFNACAPGQSCGLWGNVPDSSVCIEPDVAAPEGATCYDEDTCAPGLTCVGVDAAGVCEPWCKVDEADCRMGERCVPHPFLSQFVTPLQIEGVEFGVCAEPQASQSNATPTAIPDFPEDAADDFVQTPASSSIAISGAGSALNDVLVEVNLTHSYVGDLVLVLTAPDGSSVLLFVGDGELLGRNMVDTVFTDSAASTISDGTSPYTGEFQPYEPLAAFVGLDPNGEWTLQVYDLFADDQGSLESWRLTIY